MFDSHIVRRDFPLFAQPVHQGLVYLDSAATSQKPQVVLDAIADYYRTSTANVHRGVHTLSDASTHVWEESRKTIAHFFGAMPQELIITRNTTEALNGVAYGWGDAHLKPGDVILTTLLEHHANIVPWQQLCARTGAELVFVPVVPQTGRVAWDTFEELLKQYGARIRLVACTHVSNTLGTLVPVDKLVALVRATCSGDSPRILIDGAQAAPHIPVNFDALGVDFYAFSGHKMLGPMGSGGLLVRSKLLESGEMQPWFFGGGMIAEVHTTGTQLHPDPQERFTAGTPDVASAAGLAAACNYLTALDMKEVAKHDAQLVTYATQQLHAAPGVQLVGPLPTAADSIFDRCGSVAFVYTGVHAHDVAQVLDSEGIAVRSGHHCTMPLHEACGWQATVRASFSVYTTTEDIDALCAGLKKVAQVFGTP